MASCEDCWTRAYTIARMTGRHQAEVYRELIAASPKSHDQSEAEPDTERLVIGMKGTDHAR